VISRHQLTDSVVVLEPSWEIDRYGNRVSVWDLPLRRPYVGRLFMTASREEEKYRDAAVDTFTLLLPPSAVITHHDRLLCGGRRFEVLSVQPRRLAGRPHHLTVRLRSVEGWDDGPS
jgi:hypothetical protein